jgi:predicted AlkP superfamily pyrophosphatase or phosphodiesterase
LRPSERTLAGGLSLARRLPSIGLVALVLGACGHRAANPAAATSGLPSIAPPSARVVIFSVDGLRPDALGARTPVMKALATGGAYTFQAQTIMPSTTLPSHASMLSGYPPSAHGITWDDYQADKGPIPVPTVFAVARAAGLHTVVVAGKEKLRQLDIPGTIERFDLCASEDQEVASRAMAEAAGGFDLMFVHLPQTDLTGHAKGWMSAAYLDAVAGADAAIGRVLAALPAGTTVIVTADHGGHVNNHGTTDASDMTIPWIVSGPRVAVHALATRVNTTDTAATALWVLGLRLGAGATGHPVAEAFTAAAPTAGVATARLAGHLP